jgi:hypothetical protein
MLALRLRRCGPGPKTKNEKLKERQAAGTDLGPSKTRQQVHCEIAYGTGLGEQGQDQKVLEKVRQSVDRREREPQENGDRAEGSRWAEPS